MLGEVRLIEWIWNKPSDSPAQQDQRRKNHYDRPQNYDSRPFENAVHKLSKRIIGAISTCDDVRYRRLRIAGHGPLRYRFYPGCRHISHDFLDFRRLSQHDHGTHFGHFPPAHD